MAEGLRPGTNRNLLVYKPATAFLEPVKLMQPISERDPPSSFDEGVARGSSKRAG